MIVTELADHDPRWPQALALILTGTTDVAVARPRVAELLQFIQSQHLNLRTIVAANEGAALVAAASAIESPGRSALALIPPDPRCGERPAVVSLCLERVRQAAARHGVALLQALVLPEDANQASVCRGAGFAFLAELIYADRPVAQAVPIRLPATDLQFHNYSPSHHRLFARALELSYEQSLDCPKLTGLRTTDDILAGHRATGVHDPRLWFVAVRGGEAVGTLLLSPVPQRACVELVYMGVSAPARRQGIGDHLLAQAFKCCQERGFPTLTLAVDSANLPARRLYARWGFVETARRRAWVAKCGRAPQIV